MVTNRRSGATAAALTDAMRGRLKADLERGIAILGLQITPQQQKLLIRFIELLSRWNSAFNLTAVRDPVEMVPRHLLDSLSILPWVAPGRVLDIGTGAGLPGIPLAICRPDCALTLLDSNGKKIRFVRQAAADLGLEHLEAVHARAESYRPRRKFATITSRAVTSLSELCRTAQPLMHADGRLLIMKGRIPDNELADLAHHPNANAAVQRLHVPLLDAERHLVEIRVAFGSTS